MKKAVYEVDFFAFLIKASFFFFSFQPPDCPVALSSPALFKGAAEASDLQSFGWRTRTLRSVEHQYLPSVDSRKENLTTLLN